jgi:hypothetical protein
MELDPIDELVLRSSPPKIQTKKQEVIHRTRPWEASAIARSKPMKELKKMYLEPYHQNVENK